MYYRSIIVSLMYIVRYGRWGRSAYMIAQDADSCVVFGMPKEAISLGGAASVLPLIQICDAVLAGCADTD